MPAFRTTFVFSQAGFSKNNKQQKQQHKTNNTHTPEIIMPSEPQKAKIDHKPEPVSQKEHVKSQAQLNREAAADILNTELFEWRQIGELMDTYYRKNMQDWTAFDKILVQLVMQGMTMHENIQKAIDNLKNLPYSDRLLADFESRALKREFAACYHSIYVQFAIFYKQDPKLVIGLIQYGADSLFPKLSWHDRIALLDQVRTFDLPFKDKFTLKMALSFLMEPYGDYSFNTSIDVTIIFISKLQNWLSTSTTSLISKVELWSKV